MTKRNLLTIATAICLYAMPNVVLAETSDVMNVDNSNVMNETESKRGFGFHKGYPKVKLGCFNHDLMRGLNAISNHLGRPVTVISGNDGRHAHRSYHYRCMAADIRVSGVSNSQLASTAKRYFNGVGLYTGRRGHVHVDVRGSKFYW